MIAFLLSGLGAAAPAGLNASLPLLILALADRLTTVVDLDSPYDFLSSNVGIVILLLILPVELLADKVAKVDHVNDLFHTLFRPAAGAIMMMAITSQDDRIPPFVGLILGAVVAGAVHWFKFTSRPSITTVTKGLGNPLISMAEDFAVVVCTLVAIFLPYGVIVVLPLFGWVVFRLTRHMQRGGFSLGRLTANSSRPKVQK